MTETSNLINFQNYGVYADLVRENYTMINTNGIDKTNIDSHIKSILNIMRDGIETEEIRHMFINVTFADGIDIDLSIFDYLFNLIFWNFPIKVEEPVTTKYLFFEEDMTKNAIKKYIDILFIDEYRSKLPNIILNNIIDDTLYYFKYINDFSMYLANTINLEDTIKLMRENKEFYDLLHTDMTGVPLADVKNVGMDNMNKMIKIIKNSDHCLSDSFRTGEGINPRQAKEAYTNIGSKPDGQRGVFPAIINSNYLTGGVNDTLSYYIDSATARTAQILQKMNVGTSGHFARLIGLNNSDTILHEDKNYICNTKNFQKIAIKNDAILTMYENRYYRFNPNGVEYKVSAKDKQLIGQTVYFRSPMTCASHSRGEGICYRCYGDLAHTNSDINIGKIAAEILSSVLTQKLLSAKHLLESLVKKIVWSKGFFNIFELDVNIIQLITDNNYKGWKISIDPEDIKAEDEYEDYEYNEFITKFQIINYKGEIIDIHTADLDSIYISTEFNEMIRTKAVAVDDTIQLDLEDLKEIPLFLLHIHNNELQQTLDDLKKILDNSTRIKDIDKDEWLQMLVEKVIEGNIDITAVHCELMLSNQLRSTDNELEKPEWEYVDENYLVYTLNRALTNNPSVTVRLDYQKISKALYNPLTFKANAPSFLDLFFMEKPTEFISKEIMTKEDVPTDKEQNQIEAITFISNDENDEN